MNWQLFRSVRSLFILLLTISSSVQALALNQDNISSTFPEPRRVLLFSEQKPHIGARMGVATPEDDYDGAFEYGVEIGYQPYIPFGFGLEFTTFSSDNGNASDLDRTRLIAKGTYNFGGPILLIKDSYVGAGLGPVFDSISNTTRTRLGIDVLAGFDLPLSSKNAFQADSFSIGANANYLFVSSAAPDSFGLTGLLKYWY